MKQVLHIFRKDVRHRWIELLVLPALLIAYAWNEMRSWSRPGSMAYGVAGFFYEGTPELLRFMLPLTWILLVIRTVQEESLVGDRQFWVTRPYDWRQLLRAKMLFAFCFINIPLFLLQSYLLFKAGFPPQQHLAALFAVELTIAFIVIFPVLSLSTLTASLAQFALAVVGIILYTSAGIFVSSKIPSSSFGDEAGGVISVLSVVTLLAVIFLQYSSRKTHTSRMLVAALGLAILIMTAAWPYRISVLREYPPLTANQAAPIDFSLAPPKPNDEKAPRSMSLAEKSIPISLPLQLAGMSPDSIIVWKGQLVALESPNGLRWNSGWQPQGQQIFTDQKEAGVNFGLDREFFDRLQNLPVNLTVTFAYEVYHDEDRRDFIIPEGQFVLPEIGVCSSDSSFARALSCRAALPGYRNLLVTADLSTHASYIRTKFEPNQEQSVACGCDVHPASLIHLYLLSRELSSTSVAVGVEAGLAAPQEVFARAPR